MPKRENKKPVENSDQKSASKDLTARQIVNRHIQVKNDKITDADIMNVRIDSSMPKNKVKQLLDNADDTERSEDADKNNKTITPWDITNE